MCFSATASFVVGGALGAVGVATLYRVKTRRELPFAAIPLLFAIQQFIEGILWLSFDYDTGLLQSMATYAFTMFSHVLWPIYIPFAVWLMEREPWHKKVIWLFRIIGLAAGFQLLLLITTQPLTVIAVEHIIYVSPNIYDWPMMMLYIAATCLVSFFSTHLLIRIFGLLALLLFVISYLFYTEAFISVWCFFAAILSLIVYFQFNQRRI